MTTTPDQAETPAQRRERLQLLRFPAWIQDRARALLAADAVRVLTVRQPWADAITLPAEVWAEICPGLADGAPKDIENRVWGTTWTGTLFIHAGVNPDRETMREYGLNKTRFVYGAVVGTADMPGVVRDSTSRWAQPGRYHWNLGNQHRLVTPRILDGGQGIRKPSPALLGDILTQAPWLR